MTLVTQKKTVPILKQFARVEKKHGFGGRRLVYEQGVQPGTSRTGKWRAATVLSTHAETSARKAWISPDDSTTTSRVFEHEVRSATRTIWGVADRERTTALLSEHVYQQKQFQGQAQQPDDRLPVLGSRVLPLLVRQRPLDATPSAPGDPWRGEECAMSHCRDLL